MIPSIKGGWLPESAEDFEVLVLGDRKSVV